MKKKYPYKQTKFEYFLAYFHAKPLHTCGMLMIFPGVILVPIILVLKDVGDEAFNLFGGLWFFMAFVLLVFGQIYETGPDPSRWEEDPFNKDK